MLSFLQRAKAFSVHNHVLFCGIIFTLNELRPDPESLGACVDGGTNFESVVLVEQYSVENITFAGSVFAYNSYDTDMFLLVDFSAEPFDGLLVNG